VNSSMRGTREDQEVDVLFPKLSEPASRVDAVQHADTQHSFPSHLEHL